MELLLVNNSLNLVRINGVVTKIAVVLATETIPATKIGTVNLSFQELVFDFDPLTKRATTNGYIFTFN